jgi:hypothetical protein
VSPRHKGPWFPKDYAAAEAYLEAVGGAVGLIDQYVPVDGVGEEPYVARFLGLGEDGHGGVCAYVRLRGDCIVVGVHYARIKGRT